MPAYDQAYRDAQYERLKGKIEEQVGAMFAGRGADFGAHKAILADRMAKLRTEIDLNADDKLASLDETRRQETAAIDEQKRRESRQDTLTAQKEASDRSMYQEEVSRTERASREENDYYDKMLKRMYPQLADKETPPAAASSEPWWKRGKRNFRGQNDVSVIPNLVNTAGPGGLRPSSAFVPVAGFRSFPNSQGNVRTSNPITTTTGGKRQPPQYLIDALVREGKQPDFRDLHKWGNIYPNDYSVVGQGGREWFNPFTGQYEQVAQHDRRTDRQLYESTYQQNSKIQNEQKFYPHGDPTTVTGPGGNNVQTDPGFNDGDKPQPKQRGWWDDVFDSAGNQDFQKRDMQTDGGRLPPLGDIPDKKFYEDSGLGTTEDLQRELLNRPKPNNPGQSQLGDGTATASIGFRNFDAAPGMTYADQLKKKPIQGAGGYRGFRNFAGVA